MERRHLENREACPLLPVVGGVLTAQVTVEFKRNYNADFYHASLRYAQSLWMEGKPAQALLQLNKALMADLAGDETILSEWPLPYAAKRWVMVNCPAGEFLGNPVRHYQHLATRMSGPRPELRRWRAWACFHLAEVVVGGEANPRDERQLEREKIVIPELSEALVQLGNLGLRWEAKLAEEVIAG